jgi:hypothetical protein
VKVAIGGNGTALGGIQPMNHTPAPTMGLYDVGEGMYAVLTTSFLHVCGRLA